MTIYPLAPRPAPALELQQLPPAEVRYPPPPTLGDVGDEITEPAAPAARRLRGPRP